MSRTRRPRLLAAITMLVATSLFAIPAHPAAAATGPVTRVSVASDGSQAGISPSDDPSISADGTRIAFESDANNLVAGDSNGDDDIFVHDTVTGTTTRVSVASDGTQGNNHSRLGTISADGTKVAFISWASNLVAGDTNIREDVFVHDLTTGTTTRVSVAADGSKSAALRVGTVCSTRCGPQL